MHQPSKQLVPAPIPSEQFENFRGQWVALDKDGAQVLASAEELDALEDQLQAMGLDPESLVFDRIEDDDVIVGGAGMV